MISNLGTITLLGRYTNSSGIYVNETVIGTTKVTHTCLVDSDVCELFISHEHALSFLPYLKLDRTGYNADKNVWREGEIQRAFFFIRRS